MKCPECGMEIEEGAKFCTGCGYRMDGTEPVPAETNEGDETYSKPAGTYPVSQEPVGAAPYVNTAAAGAAVAAKPAANNVKLPREKRAMAPCKPLSTWAFVWRSIVYTIPVIGLILLFVFAFAKNVNENSKSHARSKLIFALIAAIVAIAGTILFFIFKDSILKCVGEALQRFIDTYAK